MRKAKNVLSKLQDIDVLYSRLEQHNQARKKVNKWDRNFKFFHTKAFFKRQKNIITRLQNERKEWLDGDNMEKLILNYFQSIFLATETVRQMDYLEPLGVGLWTH